MLHVCSSRRGSPKKLSGFDLQNSDLLAWPAMSGGIWDEQLEDEQSLILFRQSLPSKQPVQVGERSAFSEMETHLKNVDVQPHNC